MDQSGMTPKFSICLTLDSKTAQDVHAIREALPPSPYRDDTPHVTLLRTIKCPSHMSDTELLQDMERLLEPIEELAATVRKIANIFSPLFGVSSQIQLNASPEMEACRKHILRTLEANNYSVGLFEHLAFLPHISIRLGVPYTKQARIMTEQSFKAETRLTFNKWIILRDIKKEGKYLVKEIAPNKLDG